MEEIKSMVTFVLELGWMMVSLAEVRNTGKRLPRVEPSKYDYGKTELKVLFVSLDPNVV